MRMNILRRTSRDGELDGRRSFHECIWLVEVTCTGIATSRTRNQICRLRASSLCVRQLVFTPSFFPRKLTARGYATTGKVGAKRFCDCCASAAPRKVIKERLETNNIFAHKQNEGQENVGIKMSVYKSHAVVEREEAHEKGSVEDTGDLRLQEGNPGRQSVLVSG
jgi:hypothetical protein